MKPKLNRFQKVLEFLLIASSRHPFFFVVLSFASMFSVFMLLSFGAFLPKIATFVLVSFVLGYLGFGFLVLAPLSFWAWANIFGIPNVWDGYIALLGTLAGRGRKWWPNERD